ncbi:intra-flagellar transport protein 57, partial [Kipferlia bialata]
SGEEVCALLHAAADRLFQERSPSAPTRRDWVCTVGEQERVDVPESEGEEEEAYGVGEAVPQSRSMTTRPAMRDAPGRASTSTLRGEAGTAAPGIGSHAAWRMEVESMGSALPTPGDILRQARQGTIGGGDWRVGVAAMQKYKGTADTATQRSGPLLGALLTDLDQSLAKISTREKYLNQQVSDLLTELRSEETKREASQGTADTLSGEVADLAQRLGDINTRIQRYQTLLSSASDKMSDIQPLTEIKEAVHGLGQEIKELELKLTLSQDRLWTEQVAVK